MVPGARVRVLAPFDLAFPGEFIVASVDEANTTAWLEGQESAFDFRYLEVVIG